MFKTVVYVTGCYHLCHGLAFWFQTRFIVSGIKTLVYVFFVNEFALACRKCPKSCNTSLTKCGKYVVTLNQR